MDKSHDRVVISAKNNMCLLAKMRKQVNVSTILDRNYLLLPTSFLTLRGIDIMPQYQRAGTLVHLVMINNSDSDVHIKEGDELCECVYLD